jgi:Tetratricopeptide repeat/Glycosyltransferase family 9 (heptosyltransferase)
MSDQSQIGILMRQAAAAKETGALAEADALYRRILTQDPIHGDALREHVVIATKLGQPEDALAALDTASRLDAANAEWPFGRALVLAAAERPEEAIAAYNAAIALRPSEFIYRQGRAGLLATAGRIEDAMADLDAAIALRPDSVETHMVRGGILSRLRRFDDALNAYDRAIELQQDFAHAWFAKALLLLTLGRYQEGWPLHEWRWFVPDMVGQERLFSQPMWDGKPFHGQTLYVHVEQGLGDSIQFYRFVRLAQQFGHVVLGVPERLQALFSGEPCAPMVIATGQPMPRIDLHCPMMSLPWLLGIELHTLPAEPYLHGNPQRAAAGEMKLSMPRDRPRVGIVWAGNPRHPNDRHRSMPLSTMLEMIVPGVAVVSLQMNVPDRDLNTLRDAAHVVDVRHDLANLAETAAVISQLDLVISIDTSVAHLAGAMGKPVWLLLSDKSDWRWLLDREDSPWYPSVRIFRQEKLDDWTGVAARVRRALEGWIAPQ